MKIKSSFFKAILLIAVVASAHMLLSDLAECAEPLKVGVDMHLSGSFVRYGREAKISSEMAAEEINAKGGILGRPIKLIIRDDATNPELALRNAKDFVYKEKVDWIIGPNSTAVVLAISKFAQENKVLHLAFNSGVATVGKFGHRYHFKVGQNSYYLGKSQAPAQKRFFPEVKKWFILQPDYEYGHAIAEASWKALKAIDPDAQLVGEAFYPFPQIEDFTPFITKILGSGAEGLMSAIPGSALQTWVMQSSGFGLHKKLKVYCVEYGNTELTSPLKDMGAELRGSLAGVYYPFNIFDNPMSNHFYKAFYKRTKEYPGIVAAVAYSSFYIMKDVIEDVGTFDTEKIIDALEDRTVPTVFGPTLMRGCDHALMAPFYYGIIEYDKSKWPFPYIKSEGAWYLDPIKGSYTCEEIAELRKQAAGK